MSSIGYYRYKTTVTDGRLVAFFVNSIQAKVSEIRAIEFCEGYKILKYLDSTGQYKFFSFTKYFETNDRPTQIGSTNEFITSLRNDQTNSKNIGYKNDRSISLSAEVDEEQLLRLSEIYTSPRIYLYVGNGSTDTLADWVEVAKLTGDTTVTRRKQKTGLVNITITLPEWFTIKMI